MPVFKLSKVKGSNKINFSTLIKSENASEQDVRQFESNSRKVGRITKFKMLGRLR